MPAVLIECAGQKSIYFYHEVTDMHAIIKVKPLLFHLALPAATGALSLYLAGSPREAYASLYLPAFAPPFLPAVILWSILSLSAGTAAYLVSTARRLSRSDRGASMSLYGILLFASFLWGFLFFRFRMFSFAAWWTVLLLAVALLCTALFYRIRRSAGLLLSPVAAWLLYLGLVNFSIALMN